jgi:hypothetical protein
MPPSIRPLDLVFEVGSDLVGEIFLRSTAPERRHQPCSGSGPSTRAIAALSRRQRLDSRASLARPVLVSV